MNTLRLSVALCTFNGAPFLRDQLETIAAQTQLPDELVICDDGSTDPTLQLLDDFIRHAPFPVHLHRRDKPIGSTRNFSETMALCQGDVIVLADQDDVWLPERLRNTERAFVSAPDAGAFFSDAEVVDTSLKSLGYRLWDVVRFGPREQARFQRGQAVPLLLQRNVVTGATLAFKSEFRNLILPIPGGWVHDGWIALLIAATGRIIFSPEPLIQYRQHSGNQIGAVKRGFTERLEDAAAPRSDSYADAANNFAAARERLLTIGATPPSSEVIRSLEAKIAHMRTRASFPRSRILRLPKAVNELAAGRYHCYSNSWKSFARDIWF
jgi:glycosyltransferase involved in cell wall biosynthesis